MDDRLRRMKEAGVPPWFDIGMILEDETVAQLRAATETLKALEPAIKQAAIQAYRAAARLEMATEGEDLGDELFNLVCKYSGAEELQELLLGVIKHLEAARLEVGPDLKLADWVLEERHRLGAPWPKTDEEKKQQVSP